MSNFETLRLYSPALNGFSAALANVQQALPPQLQSRLKEIIGNYFLSYGIDGMYYRMNDRTVAQILAEYQPGDARVMASGEVDGVRYQLADPAPDPSGEVRKAKD